ncbi:hypothetical protein CEXT_570251 [Caerostris extrusa]|uniref:C2H2-type domain-containing protein n=1 Tax=Caerostris extrusa TaxID=172846 RepID=A0AAV4W939_CAEEX|nr:hypothetical protein CEXT_570251 [Caerostris extrusa]
MKNLIHVRYAIAATLPTATLPFSSTSYECTKCRKWFASHSTLCEHVRLVHTAENQYKCTKCGKCFAYPCRLREHVRITHKCKCGIGKPLQAARTRPLQPHS